MIALPLMLLVTVKHAPETPSLLVYSKMFTDSEKASQWFNVTNQSILIANLCPCICVPIMDIIFSFINMRWWTTQQASFVNHSLSMLRAFSVSFSKSKMQWHTALLKNVTSVCQLHWVISRLSNCDLTMLRNKSFNCDLEWKDGKFSCDMN